MVSCDFSPFMKRVRLLTADFGLNAFSIWFALLTILSETVAAVIQNLINSGGSQAAIDAVKKVVGGDDKLMKVNDALGATGTLSGSDIASKSKYAVTFAVAVAAEAVQALLVIIFLYLGILLVIMYLSPQSRQQKLSHTLHDWYDQEVYWNGVFLHPRLSRALLIKSFACTINLIIVIFGLAIVPSGGVAVAAIAFPFIQTVITILNSVPLSGAICVAMKPDIKNDALRDSILDFELKNLPEISTFEMLTKRTTDLLTRGEAFAMASSLDKQMGDRCTADVVHVESEAQA